LQWFPKALRVAWVKILGEQIGRRIMCRGFWEEYLRERQDLAVEEALNDPMRALYLA
jgi:hypothetical protein